ncbi:hypothetical protein HAX54_048891 [Datura stramonium]|uniref:Uncharacterized protein n=1 Tax=Datura stramonium TaxID=4076 RepID=A0ABS8SV07_DATST|nr:hypothetical protein [Datura stramonium]
MRKALALMRYQMRDAVLVLRDSMHEAPVSLHDITCNTAQKLHDDMREPQPFQRYSRREAPFHLCDAVRDAARAAATAASPLFRSAGQRLRSRWLLWFFFWQAAPVDSFVLLSAWLLGWQLRCAALLLLLLGCDWQCSTAAAASAKWFAGGCCAFFLRKKF